MFVGVSHFVGVGDANAEASLVEGDRTLGRQNVLLLVREEMLLVQVLPMYGVFEKLEMRFCEASPIRLRRSV